MYFGYTKGIYKGDNVEIERLIRVGEEGASLKRKIISLGICIIIFVSIIANNHIVLTKPPGQVNQKDNEILDNENEIIMPENRGTRAAPGWMDEVRLTDSAGESTYPDMAVWGSNVHVVWSDKRDGHYEIYYKRSVNKGTSWNSDTRLTFTSNDQLEPRMTIYQNNIHVVWHSHVSCEVYYINSTNNGDTWGSITAWDWTSYPPSGSGDMIVEPDVTAGVS